MMNVNITFCGDMWYASTDFFAGYPECIDKDTDERVLTRRISQMYDMYTKTFNYDDASLCKGVL